MELSAHALTYTLLIIRNLQYESHLDQSLLLLTDYRSGRCSKFVGQCRDHYLDPFKEPLGKLLFSQFRYDRELLGVLRGLRGPQYRGSDPKQAQTENIFKNLQIRAGGYGTHYTRSRCLSITVRPPLPMSLYHCQTSAPNVSLSLSDTCHSVMSLNHPRHFFHRLYST